MERHTVRCALVYGGRAAGTETSADFVCCGARDLIEPTSLTYAPQVQHPSWRLPGQKDVPEPLRPLPLLLASAPRLGDERQAY